MFTDDLGLLTSPRLSSFLNVIFSLAPPESPPYFDKGWGPWAKWRQIYAEAKRLRGKRWMEFAAAFAPALRAYLEEPPGLDPAAKRATGILNAIEDFAYSQG